MEQRDLELLNKYCDQDAELKTLWAEHLFYEQQLDKLDRKPFLTPDEERVAKELKKKKLSGKTKIQAKLDRIKQTEA